MRQFFYSLCMLLFLVACTNGEEFLESLQEDSEELPIDPPPTDDETTDDENDDSEDDSTDGEEDNNDDNNDDQEDDAYYGEVKAFPTAQGAGAYTVGGRGGAVIPVTTLEDGNYEGTLRWALTRSYPRTVVFRVSGEINLNSELMISGNDKGYLTVAGQTAPEGGITIKGERVFFFDVDEVILRYIRIRQDRNNNEDVLTIMACSDFIIDHVSASYGGDECISVTDGRQYIDNITIQKTLIGESKTGSILGAISQGNDGRENNAGDFSFHHNLFVDVSHRFPNTSGNGNFEIINNVIHNWDSRLSRLNNEPKINFINNYYQQGLVTQNNDIQRVMHKLAYSANNDPEIYIAGNIVWPGVLTNPSADNWFMFSIFLNSGNYAANDPVPIEFKQNSPFSLMGSPIQIENANDAYNTVVNDVGSNATVSSTGEIVYYTDNLDMSYINKVKSRSSNLYRSVNQYDYPRLPSNTPYKDDDLDGMPNDWEIAKGLDPNNAEDRNGDENGNGYTNLEDFLNRVDL